MISDTHLPKGPRRLPNAWPRFPDADAVVFERRRAPERTMGMARAEAGRVEFELVALD